MFCNSFLGLVGAFALRMRYRTVARGSVAQKDRTIAKLLKCRPALVGAFASRSRAQRVARWLVGGEAREWVEIR
eukprot:5702084-Pyramimonas_sp.AAC.1